MDGLFESSTNKHHTVSSNGRPQAMPSFEYFPTYQPTMFVDFVFFSPAAGPTVGVANATPAPELEGPCCERFFGLKAAVTANPDIPLHTTPCLIQATQDW